MTLLRLILLFFLGVMIRRLFLSFRGGERRKAGPETRRRGAETPPDQNPEYTDLTEQGIDDADFEEIP